jgi:beta-galactosidase
VAVIYNPLSHFVGGRQRATAYGGPQGEVATIERDSLLGIHKALFPANVPLDYVHIDGLTVDQLRPYKLVYLAYPLMLAERAATVFKQYVADGGALVAEARLGWNNGAASHRTVSGMGCGSDGLPRTIVQTGRRV